MIDICQRKELATKGFMLGQNVEIGEIEPFFDSLGADKWLWGQPPKPILSAEFVTGIRTIDKELAAVGGVTKSYGLVPTLFIIVGPRFRGKGLGNELLADVLGFARTNYSFLYLSVREGEAQIPARHLYQENGFKPFYRERNNCMMYIPFNRRGKLIGKLLPLVYFVFHCVNCLPPLAHILNYIYDYFLRRQYKRNRLQEYNALDKSINCE